MVNDFLIENRTPDPADQPHEYYCLCAECEKPIEYDGPIWESLYVETEDGPMHLECAEAWFRRWIDQNKREAVRV